MTNVFVTCDAKAVTISFSGFNVAASGRQNHQCYDSNRNPESAFLQCCTVYCFTATVIIDWACEGRPPFIPVVSLGVPQTCGSFRRQYESPEKKKLDRIVE